MRLVRPAQLCRSWLFLEGANEAVLQRAATSGADVLIQELEDFTPAPLRPAGRALAPELYRAWRETGGRGLVQTDGIAKASKRTRACLLAPEDLPADLGAERGQDGIELAYCRERFIVECVAAGVVAFDCPYTWSDSVGVERDALWARRLGCCA